jgi:hypothetical protein
MATYLAYQTKNKSVAAQVTMASGGMAAKRLIRPFSPSVLGSHTQAIFGLGLVLTLLAVCYLSGFSIQGQEVQHDVWPPNESAYPILIVHWTTAACDGYRRGKLSPTGSITLQDESLKCQSARVLVMILR